MPEETKPWYLSKTILGVIVGVVASLLAYLTKTPAIEAGIEAESANITALVAQVVAVIGGIVAVVGRIVATTKISK